MGRNLDDYSGFQQIPGMPILLKQSVLVHDTSNSSNLQFTHKEDHHSWSTITPKKGILQIWDLEQWCPSPNMKIFVMNKGSNSGIKSQKLNSELKLFFCLWLMNSTTFFCLGFLYISTAILELGLVKQGRQDKTDGGRQCLGDFFIVHTSKVNLGLKENKKKLWSLFFTEGTLFLVLL